MGGPEPAPRVRVSAPLKTSGFCGPCFIRGNIIILAHSNQIEKDAKNLRSTLDSNVSNIPRHAEASDGRLAIREHEEQPRRKREQDKREPALLPEDMYDQSAIAIPALIEFLRNFLKSIDSSADPTSAVSQAQNTVSPDGPTNNEIAPPQNPAAARAASAYQHTAHARDGGQHVIRSVEPGAAQSLLQTSEVRQIHALMTKLNTLDSRGVTAIKLEKASSFLMALDISADRALALK